MDESKLKFDFIQLEIGLYTKDWETAKILRSKWYEQRPVEFQGLPYMVTSQSSIPSIDGTETIHLFKLKLWWARDQLHDPVIHIEELTKSEI